MGANSNYERVGEFEKRYCSLDRAMVAIFKKMSKEQKTTFSELVRNAMEMYADSVLQ